jgi:hypothetical protein
MTIRELIEFLNKIPENCRDGNVYCENINTTEKFPLWTLNTVYAAKDGSGDECTLLINYNGRE